MVLQYFLPRADFRTPPSHEYYFFVEVTRMLAELGFSEVCLKLHPGAAREQYYERIADTFGLRCTIARTRPLSDYFEWPDIAIGAPSSGAMYEVAEAGIPFFPVLLPPHSMSFTSSENNHIFSDFETLKTAIRSDSAPDLTEILNNFTSSVDIPDPAAATWNALRERTVKAS